MTKILSFTTMMTLSINDRISYKGEKATVKQVWKKKVKIILSDLSEMTVLVDDVNPWTETAWVQTSLLDLSQYQDRLGLTDWELENEDALDSNLLDPKSSDPKSLDPKSLDTNLLAPNHRRKPRRKPRRDYSRGYEEIKTINGLQYLYRRWYENGKKRSEYLGLYLNSST